MTTTTTLLLSLPLLQLPLRLSLYLIQLLEYHIIHLSILSQQCRVQRHHVLDCPVQLILHSDLGQLEVCALVIPFRDYVDDAVGRVPWLRLAAGVDIGDFWGGGSGVVGSEQGGGAACIVIEGGCVEVESAATFSDELVSYYVRGAVASVCFLR